MALKQLQLNSFYRSPVDSNSETLYIPCIRECVKYYRSAGFFSLKALCEGFDDIIDLIKRSGEVRIITSPKLNDDEIKILENAFDKEKVVIDSLLRSIENTKPQVDEDKLEALASLIANDAIKIRIVFNEKGLYHEKCGYFIDENNDAVWFIGSDNESIAGHKHNIELTYVGKSWVDPATFGEIQSLFIDAWNGTVPNSHTLSIPDVIKNKLFDGYSLVSNDEAIDKYKRKKIASLKKKELFEHQTRALNYFFNHNGKGFLEMATGTGKTFTSCKIIEKAIDLYDAFTIIIVPQVDLQIQWEKELTELGIRTYLLGGTGASGDKVESAINAAQADYLTQVKCVCIATYSTYFEKLSNIDEDFSNNLLFVVDEAHNISDNQFNKLPMAHYRLGLSATPIKHDRALSENIVNYFTNGNDSFVFTIEDAINNGFLSHYDYYPIYVHLDDDEYEKFKVYSARLAGLMSKKELTKEEREKINSIANERSVIVKKAKSKLEKLEEILALDKEQFKRTVVYCGAGKNNDESVDERLIDSVTKLLHKYNISCQQFTSRTPDREKVLEYFKDDYYDVLVAIHCFDEGIDVPQLEKIYIMASDRLTRQTVQRRGRVLRICKESGKDKGYIYDFCVLPPEGGDSSGAKSLVRLEFSRLREYIRLADNKNIFLPKINEIENEYGLIWNDEENEYERDNIEDIDEEE